jgi:hypothetical protein
MAGHPKQLALAACCEACPAGARQRSVKLITIPGMEADTTSTTAAETTSTTIPMSTSLSSNQAIKSSGRETVNVVANLQENDTTTATGVTQWYSNDIMLLN